MFRHHARSQLGAASGRSAATASASHSARASSRRAGSSTSSATRSPAPLIGPGRRRAPRGPHDGPQPVEAAHGIEDEAPQLEPGGVGAVPAVDGRDGALVAGGPGRGQGRGVVVARRAVGVGERLDRDAEPLLQRPARLGQVVVLSGRRLLAEDVVAEGVRPDRASRREPPRAGPVEEQLRHLVLRAARPQRADEVVEGRVAPLGAHALQLLADPEHGLRAPGRSPAGRGAPSRSRAGSRAFRNAQASVSHQGRAERSIRPGTR